MRAHGDGPDFRVVATSDHGTPMLRCTGELDMATSAVLCRETADVQCDVVIDFSAVTFCDSSGIALLLALEQRLRRSGHTLRIVGAQPPVLTAFTITGTAEVLLPDQERRAVSVRRAPDRYEGLEREVFGGHRSVDVSLPTRRARSTSGSGHWTFVAHPSRSKSRIVAADVSSWWASNPWRARRGKAW